MQCASVHACMHASAPAAVLQVMVCGPDFRPEASYAHGLGQCTTLRRITSLRALQGRLCTHQDDKCLQVGLARPDDKLPGRVKFTCQDGKPCGTAADARWFATEAGGCTGVTCEGALPTFKRACVADTEIGGSAVTRRVHTCTNWAHPQAAIPKRFSSCK